MMKLSCAKQDLSHNKINNMYTKILNKTNS